MKSILLSDKIYNATIYIIPSYKPHEIVKYFKKSHGILYEVDNSISGMHYSLESKEAGTIDHFIIFKDFQNSSDGISLLFHEVYHCACAVMCEVGMTLSEDSEEAYAYYLQYLTNQILNKIL